MMSQRYKKELKVLRTSVGFFSAFGFFGIPTISTGNLFPQEFSKLEARLRFVHAIASVSPQIGLSCKHHLKGPGISKCKT